MACLNSGGYRTRCCPIYNPSSNKPICRPSGKDDFKTFFWGQRKLSSTWATPEGKKLQVWDLSNTLLLGSLSVDIASVVTPFRLFVGSTTVSLSLTVPLAITFDPSIGDTGGGRIGIGGGGASNVGVGAGK